MSDPRLLKWDKLFQPSYRKKERFSIGSLNKAISQCHTLMEARGLKIYCSFFSQWPLVMLLTAVFVLQSELDWHHGNLRDLKKHLGFLVYLSLVLIDSFLDYC